MSTAKRIGKYDIVALVSRGSRAALYRATDGDTRQPVAIKIVPRTLLNADALPAFRKYSQELTRLEHPGIATFLDIVENDKALALVSEFCEGKPLSEVLREGARPELRNVWDIARPMLEALGTAHLRGAVHRDLKPANLMLATDGSLKITDFGVAALLAGPDPDLHYRAPEQFADGPVTPRTDVYQAGAIVYQLVTGKLPFTGTPEEIAHRVSEERPSDPSSYDKRIAWQLDWVIQKALSKDPAERFATAIEFAEGLRLGLQETAGRPLEAIRMFAAAPAAAPATAPAAAPAAAPANAPAAVARPAAAAVARPAAATVTSVAPPDNGKPRVLFVDDDERILNGLRTLFRHEYNVATASSGEAALEIVGRGGIHVVVSDQRMPGMMGVELLRKVRTVAPNAVRLLLTGYTDLASLVGSINEGEIFRFVKKPWENDDLRRDVADAVKVALAHAGEQPAKAESPRTAGSLLVIDPKEGLARGLERLLAGTATVVQVKNPADAAKAFQGNEFAAIVADLGAGMDGLVALFKQVKAKRPGVLTILLADEPDSELGIELVNKAQIFRFLPKPVSAKDLRHAVAEALRRYATFKQSALAQDSGGSAQAAVAAPALARSA